MLDTTGPYKNGPENKRRHKRFTVDVMKINGKMIFANNVKVLDLSMGGISIKADRRLNIGCEYTLKMEDRGRVISVKGTVVWSCMNGTREGAGGDMVPVYTAGMRFTDVSSERVTELIHFIESTQKEAPGTVNIHGPSGRRLNIRFRINAPEKAVLNSPENYEVKKISMGGMLIRSEHPLEVESRLPMEVYLHDGSPIGFTGRIASCLSLGSNDREHFDIGVEFIQLSESDLAKVGEFIRLLPADDANP